MDPRSGQITRLYPSPEALDSVALSPDGTRLAAIARTPSGADLAVYDTTRQELLAEHRLDSFASLWWAPDNSCFALKTDTLSLYDASGRRLPVAGDAPARVAGPLTPGRRTVRRCSCGPPMRLPASCGSAPRGRLEQWLEIPAVALPSRLTFLFSPDGSQLAVQWQDRTDSSAHVALLDPRAALGQPLVPIYTRPPEFGPPNPSQNFHPIRSLGWTPDGKGLTFSVRDEATDESVLILWDPERGAHELYRTRRDFLFAAHWLPDGQRVLALGVVNYM